MSSSNPNPNVSNRIFPLSYSIPSEMFVQPQSCSKTHALAPLIPGDMTTYVYNTECDYNDMYRSSMYAITHKKYGWDCLRHYEIISNGCIPIFRDIDKCPHWTMHLFPKQLVSMLTQKYNEIASNNNAIDKSINDETERISNALFAYSRNYLTCEYSAARVLSIISPTNRRPKILFLSGEIGYRNVNYTRELLAIGLRRTLGDLFVDYPKINVLYKNCENLQKYIGKGFTYGGRLDDIDIDRSNIQKRIQQHEFDIVIYGKVGKKRGELDSLENLPYWSDVSSAYDNNHVVFLYGGDLMRNVTNDRDVHMHAKYGTCFVREGYIE